jgi:hypothetical protein
MVEASRGCVALPWGVTLLGHHFVALDPEIRKRWASLTSLIVVETDTTIVTTGKKRKKERRYCLGSKEESAAYFQKAIRQHWTDFTP